MAVESAMESMRPPSGAAFYTFWHCSPPVASASSLQAIPISLQMFAITIPPILWYRKRIRIFGR
jgi:hypothetical protein